MVVLQAVSYLTVLFLIHCTAFSIESDAVDSKFADDAGLNSSEGADLILLDGSSYVKLSPVNRSAKTVLVLSIGFREDKRFTRLAAASGYKVTFCCVDSAKKPLPNPEHVNGSLASYLAMINRSIAVVRPDLVVAKSYGGLYLNALWAQKLWTGPSLMINMHPSVTRLPADVRIVVAHGSNDEVNNGLKFSTLGKIMRTATENMQFLYFTDDSGRTADGGYSREGDFHEMKSLLEFDCLPRLMDAAIGHPNDGGPESYMVTHWLSSLSAQRLLGEEIVGQTPDVLMRWWRNKAGTTTQLLQDVSPATEEFKAISRIFSAQPMSGSSSAYGFNKTVHVKKIQRIENGRFLQGHVKPYFDSLKTDIENQGIAFQPGVHTRWLFHGTGAIEEIVSNPMLAFQPLLAGKNAKLWGSGTYLARDATYPIAGGYTGGQRKVLMVLAATGFPVMSYPGQEGVYPVRQHHHMYHSAVDSLVNPEIFIISHPGAAYPAYIIEY